MEIKLLIRALYRNGECEEKLSDGRLSTNKEFLRIYSHINLSLESQQSIKYHPYACHLSLL